MEKSDFVNQHILEFKRAADTIIYDIEKINWNPNHSVLDIFLKSLYLNIIDFYKEVEITQKYIYTNEVLFAYDSLNKNSLGYTIGGGFTTSELSSTHAIGFEIKRILDNYKILQKPFEFRLLIVGYKGENKNEDKNSVLTLESCLV